MEKTDVSRRPALRERLVKVSECVGGPVLADIGTDHALLPITLLKAGRISHAYATDINEGPCRRARENIAAYGLTAGIDIICCDGLSGIEDKEVTDIVIAGMGGLAICNILSASAKARSGVCLVLQPMKDAQDVRAYLYQNGYEVCTEVLAAEEGRLYHVIKARYTNICQNYTERDIVFGRFDENEPLLPFYLSKLIREKKKILSHLQNARRPDAEERVIQVRAELAVLEQISL